MGVTDPGAGTPQPDPNATPPADPVQPVPVTPSAPPSSDPAPATPAPDPAPAAPSSPDPAPAPAAPPQDPPSADLGAQLDALRQQLADLEARTQKGQLTLAQTDTELAQRVDELRQQFADWPQRGDKFADTPQPYDLQAHGLPQPGVTRDHLPGGQPDEISPVVVAHNKPLLTAGQAGDAVAELAALLAKVGYPTSISEGRNHANAFDDTVTAAVNAFKRDFHVLEDSSMFRDIQQAERFVGPYIWEALIRAGKLAEKALA